MPGLGAQALAEGSGQGHACLFHRLAGQFRHAEGQGRCVDIRQHGTEEGFMGLLVAGQRGPGQQVAERHRWRQLLALAGQARVDFAADDIQAGMVHHGVVEQQQGHHLAVFTTGIDQAQQRRLAQVHAVMRAVEALAQVPQWRFARRHRERFTGQRRLAPDHLARGVQQLPGHRRA